MIIRTLNCASGPCDIRLNDSIDRLVDLTCDMRTIIITDSNVYDLYKDRFCKTEDIIVIEPGDKSKSLAVAESVFGRFAAMEVDRSFLVVAIGGGVVTDLVGFVASTYLRGLPFGFVATTLLGQVDAAIGGKNGLNLQGYKNLIGVISQPKFVITDSSLLKTLPPVEVRCGLAEIVKAAAIGDKKLFDFLEKNAEAVLNMESEALGKIVTMAVKIKADIVERDETDKGERRLLNFGHTLGHALERAIGIRHGEAVSIGMVAAAKISEARGLLLSSERLRLEALLKKFGLPVFAPPNTESIIDSLKRDKKRRGSIIDFVLLESIGQGKIVALNIKEIEQTLLGG